MDLAAPVTLNKANQFFYHFAVTGIIFKFYTHSESLKLILIIPPADPCYLMCY